MKTHTVMKKHIYILIIFSFGLLLFANQSVFGQFERMEINYNVEEIIVDGNTVYNIEITLSNRTEKVDIYLYKDKAISEHLIKESHKFNKDIIGFKKLKKGKYILAIYESNNKGVIKKIELGNFKK